MRKLVYKLWRYFDRLYLTKMFANHKDISWNSISLRIDLCRQLLLLNYSFLQRIERGCQYTKLLWFCLNNCFSIFVETNNEIWYNFMKVSFCVELWTMSTFSESAGYFLLRPNNKQMSVCHHYAVGAASLCSSQ